jgi:hypothetical protein
MLSFEVKVLNYGLTLRFNDEYYVYILKLKIKDNVHSYG